MRKLTEREQDTYDYIVSCIKEGLPPSRKEIADKFDLWPSGADNRLKNIEAKGWIRLTGQSRGIFLTSEDDNGLEDRG